MIIKGIITDIDNTLIDIKQRDYRSFIDTAEAYSVPAVPFESFVNMRLRGASSRDIGRTFFSPHHVPEMLETFLRDRHDRLDRPELFHLDRLFPGVKGALGKLRDSQFLIVGATLRYSRDQVMDELGRLGIGMFFKDVITVSEVMCQADREYVPEYDCLVYYKHLVLQCALERTGFRRDTVVFVSDTAFDIQAANDTGLYTVAVKTGYGDNTKLSRLARSVVTDFPSFAASLLMQNGVLS